MSASNHNYVCFECRTTIRHAKTAKKKPHCLSCGAECFNLGYKVEVPKHDDLRAWRELRAECERRAEVARQERAVRSVRKQHFLEQEINRMRQMPENRDRSRQIKQLEEELSTLHKRRIGEQAAS